MPMSVLPVSTRAARLSGALVAIGLAAGAIAQVAHYPAPTFDRWNYPFNSQGGAGTEALVFGVLGPLGLNQFDDRDGQFLMTWGTGGQFTPGLGAANYEVLGARLTASIDPRFADAFVFDPTPDSWRTYLDPQDPDYLPDADPGRPVELFGTGFRNGFNAASFGENGPFSFANPALEGVRNAFARDLTGVDASNNVRDRFDAVAMAIGQASVVPGSLVPAGAMEFLLDVNNPAIQAYLQQGLNSGFLSFTIASLHEGSFGGPPTFPAFATKEGFFPGAAPSTLTIEVRIIPAPAGLLLLAGGAGLVRRRR